MRRWLRQVGRLAMGNSSSGPEGKTLAEHEAGLRSIAEAVRDYAMYLLDPSGLVVSWNPGAERVKGYRAEEVIGRSFERFYTAEDRDAGLPKRGLERAQEEGRFETSGWRVRKDGTRFYADVVITALRGPSGRLEGFLKLTRDMTERQSLLEELRIHKESLETLLDQKLAELRDKTRILQLIYDAHQDPLLLLERRPGGGYRVVSCNQACAAILGRTPDAMVGVDLLSFLSEPKQEVLQALEDALADGLVRRLERRRPGGGNTFETQVVPVTMDGGVQLVLLASRDLSDRLKVEESLRQTQKLESLGVLAGGIAHDFNNLLTSVLGNANLGRLSLPVESPGRPFFERIEDAARKAADLTRQLLAYAGKGNFLVTTVDLNRAVEEMAQLLSVSISKKAALRYDLSGVPPRIKADPTQVQQLIMNLVTNASEAIGEEHSGLITLRTGIQQLDAPYIKTLAVSLPLEPGLYATLEVSDTGCGMTPEIQSRIFDPFFTTKFAGRGLGLSAMMGILRSHHGGLKIYSEVGRGTTFKLFLPALDTCQEELPSEVSAAPWSGEGLLLVVDDEAGARSIGRQMAERLGFSVIEAADGREAVELFRLHHGALRGVLMDLTMPHLDGRGAFRDMRVINDRVPVILTSGYSESHSAQQFVGQGLAGFLQKPYRMADFVLVLRKALER